MQREANPDRCAQFAQIALMYALHASERLEIEKWRWEVTQNGYRSDFLLGCDTRGYFQMDSEELFMELFTELFNYAT
ncbi:MAG: hypothetical protein GWN27_04440, partial [candidate division Zixibacteria bacterium]|nr:hypothetical protein [candidate division Zixibacteria bacterium]